MGRGGLIVEGVHTNKTIGAKFFYYSIMGCLAFKTYANSRVGVKSVPH
jgi:hypothetical protein